VLSSISRRLESGAHGFTPSDTEEKPAQALPGRTPGANLETYEPPTAGPAAAIVDCGISRREGYTHVLWVAPAAEAMLGSHAFERLGDVMGTIPGVTRYAWEGMEKLHLNAPNVDWDDMLYSARLVIATLTSGR
jgi:hypothetical protein